MEHFTNNSPLSKFITLIDQYQMGRSLLTSYIPQENVQHFINFKYKGSNDSVSYEHLWSPLADRMLTYLPMWVAPNVITLASLLILVSTHLLFIFSGDKSEGVSSWKLLLMAITILAYQNLDNLDGKQARRTNSSSPLGMLLDHGTDSVASFLLSLQMLVILRVQGDVVILCVYAFIMLTYFAAMWSQYGSGFFRLGRVNPVDQGLPSYALVALLAIYIPSSRFTEIGVLLPFNLEILILLSFLLFFVIFFMVKDIFRNAIRAKLDILYALMLPLSIGATLVLMHYYDRSTHFSKTELPIFYSLLFTWSRNMIQLQLCFVTKQVYQPFNIGTLFFIGMVFFGCMCKQLLAECKIHYYWAMAVVTGIIFIQFVVSVFVIGADLLGIRLFKIPQRTVKQTQ